MPSAIVLDNTHLTRASRSYVLDAARPPWRGGALRLARHTARAGAGQSRRAPVGAIRRPAARPTSCVRSRAASRACSARRPRCALVRELEAPAADEGFATIERVPFERAPGTGLGQASSSWPQLSTTTTGLDRSSARATSRLRLAPGRDTRRHRRGGRPARSRKQREPWTERSARIRRGRQSAGAGRRCQASLLAFARARRGRPEGRSRAEPARSRPNAGRENARRRVRAARLGRAARPRRG